MAYYKRLVDQKLIEWKESGSHKPLLIRGARQVGKSSAVRELGKSFQYYIELNLEKQPTLCALFTEDIDVHKTCEKIAATFATPIIPGETLLFIDEIQVSQQAIMSLRYFKEDYPELHVIAAGSLLEFALQEIPSFGVGRIRSVYMYPFSFDEFLMAQGLETQVAYKQKACSIDLLPEKMHNDLIEQLKTFYLVGGMPSAVSEWIETHSYQACAVVHNDILDTYQDDFTKYKKRISPVLLRQVFRSVTLQAGSKFVFSQAAADVHTSLVKEALLLLVLAGLIIPVRHSDGNGLPLGAEENVSYTKYLFLDLGLMMTLLSIPAADILLATETELVNRGPASEMFAGLELLKYQDCFIRPELYYWQNMSKNGNAEVDYLLGHRGKVLPMEVKANTKGSMQSLWLFMRKKHLASAVRASLENFSSFEYRDKEDSDALRHVSVFPLYALSNIAAQAGQRTLHQEQ